MYTEYADDVRVETTFDHAEILELDASIAGATVGEPRRQPAADGVRRLLIALLDEALRCYQKYAFSGTRRGRRLFREVEAWFTDPHLEAGICFQDVCDGLGIDADSIRRSLERWRAEQYTGPSVSAAACRPYTGTDTGVRSVLRETIRAAGWRRRPRTGASSGVAVGA